MTFAGGDFQDSFGMKCQTAAWVGAIVIISYTFLGIMGVSQISCRTIALSVAIFIRILRVRM